MAKAIREFCGKELLHKYIEKLKSENGVEAQKELHIPFMSAPVNEATDFELLVKNYPWLDREVSVPRQARWACLFTKLIKVLCNLDHIIIHCIMYMYMLSFT